jgi:hypothetical protein
MLNDVRFGDLLKVLWWDGQGLCLFAKRLEKGRFVWPSPADGKVVISPAQLGMLLEGIDWRMPRRTWRPAAPNSRSMAARAGSFDSHNPRICSSERCLSQRSRSNSVRNASASTTAQATEPIGRALPISLSPA